jgi:hypothetical protein
MKKHTLALHSKKMNPYTNDIKDLMPKEDFIEKMQKGESITIPMDQPICITITLLDGCRIQIKEALIESFCSNELGNLSHISAISTGQEEHQGITPQQQEEMAYHWHRQSD